VENRKRRLPLRESRRSNVVHAAELNSIESSRLRRLSQARHEVDAALELVDPADRSAMPRWVTGLSLLAIAVSEGFPVAAEVAYGLADRLAVQP